MSRQQTLALASESIRSVLHKMDGAAGRGAEPGIAVVVDGDKTVIGAVTDGDIREAICKDTHLAEPVGQIMSAEPICIPAGLDSRTMLRVAFDKMADRGVVVDKLILVDEQKRFVDIVNLHVLYRGEDIVPKQVAVYGLGFVGLTLAVTLAENSMFRVEGIDIDETIVRKLQTGKPHFYEKGLVSLIHRLIDKKSIVFNTPRNARGVADVHVISVGTPLEAAERADMSYLESCAAQVGAVLRKGDLVICRSTVPVGTTRGFVVPRLERCSGLVAGRDFFVAFAPERTVEGDALRELRSLPQVVGGLTNRCRELAVTVFQKITPAVVYVESLEAAEIIKLINNSFRDLVFSFANEVAFLCDQLNIDAFDVIAAANEGYPRNTIPRPSPGVGGICLSKDPYLYSMHGGENPFATVTLGKASRGINERGAEYVLWGLNRFTREWGIEGKRLKILVAGIAFKGVPETSDIRFSIAVELIRSLRAAGHDVFSYDAVVPGDAISATGARPTTIEKGLKGCDAAFFMNDHPENGDFELYAGLMSMNRPCLFFDGWHVFSKAEIESISGVTYFTMGYMTPKIDV